ncbi:MAG: chemotaxis response regulator protein-glutamate methylesterase [Deltaproteobacteria bacterium]|nr:chemotaxis response regulator protein-glutamate methylesterase [Deltaproteobacteria bacterium]
MSKVRVLVVDDSVVVRRVLTEILQADPEIDVAGTAATASIGIQKLGQIAPDVVLLDVEMPEMDGIEAARRIREGWPKLPVIMCSALTERGADITMRALAAGASDYVAKPSGLSSTGDRDHFARELVAKVKALTGRRTVAPPARPAPTLGAATVPIARPRSARIEVVAIGSSTGGPNALATVFEAFPSDFRVPILVTQHMPPLFTKILADRLTSSSNVRVYEAKHGDLVEPGCAYIAPGNFHMTVGRDGTRLVLSLDQDPPENSCRPAVDVMFRSVARTFGPSALAVVLTGMGQDGARGAVHIVEAGGSVFVQDAATCVVASMPRSVVELGMADSEVPIERVGQEIVRRVARQGSPGNAVPRVEGWK